MSQEGFSLATASAVLGAVYKATSYSESSGLWIQLHTDHPGPAGTDNIATETTRMEATSAWGADPVDNMDGTVTLTSDSDIGPWTSVAGTETYEYYSMWSDETAGTFIDSGSVTDGSVTAGDNWTATAGTVTRTFTYAN